MPEPAAITIGNFDGVHKGHQALVHAARDAVGPGGSVVVVSFDPHPISVLRPDMTPGRLTTFAERAELLRELGADGVVAMEPRPQLLSEPPEQFVEQMVERYHPRYIVEGPDFRFGHNREGSDETLRQLEGRCGHKTIVIEPVEAVLMNQNVVRVSSTMVRWLLQRGRMRDAAALLGRPFEIAGEVVPGERRGREIGVPTANLDHVDRVLPADGIYVGYAIRPGGARFPAAISVGTKPTFGDHPRTCEVHLIGYDGPLEDYGWTLRVRIDSWLRDQIRFDRVGLLMRQLRRDIARAEALCPLNEK